MNEPLVELRGISSSDTEGAFLAQLRKDIVAYWHVVAILAVTGLLIGFFAAFTSPRSYTSTVRLVPSSNGLEYAPNSALGGFAGALQGLGMQLPKSGSGSDFILFPEVMRSSAVANAILQRKELVAKMFPAEYERESKTFRQPKGVITAIKNVYWGLFGQSGYVPPNNERVQAYIRQNVGVNEASVSTPITTLTFSHGDRDFSSEFLSAVWLTTDQQLRNWRVRAAQDNSDYLEKKLSAVSAVDYRSALITQLVPQVMIVMTNNPKSPFAARIIDGPSTGYRPSEPKPVEMILLGLVVGLAAGVGLIAARLYFPDQLWVGRILSILCFRWE